MAVKLVPELYCSDLDRSVAFYKNILGFQVCYERPEEKFAYLERQGAEIMLEELAVPGVRKWLTGDLKKPFGRGCSFQIEVSDVHALFSSVKKHGAEIFLDMEEKWYVCGEKELGNKQFIVQDPDGYLLRFFEDLGSR